ncbi:MAG: hypothetical protein A2287_03895 [Candidatus Melainabacteria bacterium RIFOXYA12_FULL_32_12]|nr:MAG: hypothetical protein A2255_11165 [Candidatus Melainabacteria bacterium RIFOXYA2_FULL_32_9]OGI29374.1 MAG: hypothetical protein A2287_03895 [Candidatus Melainabacteria bacterium RIFOXYA12_FULL_32_12]
MKIIQNTSFKSKRDLSINTKKPKENIIYSENSNKENYSGLRNDVLKVYFTGQVFNQTNKKAKFLADYINSLNQFKIADKSELDGNYNHIGATITDAILQAGLNYEKVVKPKVLHVLQKYPDAKTTSGFLKTLKEEGYPKVLVWKNQEKPERMINLLNLLKSENVENEEELKSWLKNSENINKLKEIKGIGDKTVDYLKILVGISTNAIDRHVFNFLNAANIKVKDYNEAHQIVSKTADLLAIDEAVFDYSIWKYMSTKR